MKFIIGVFVLLVLGVTFFIPERISSKDRAAYLDEELKIFSAHIGSPGFGPEHPDVRVVFEAANSVRMVSYRKNFNLAALVSAPVLALTVFLFLRSIYTEVAFLVSSLMIFLFYHGAVPLIGLLVFIVFLWGIKIIPQLFGRLKKKRSY